MKHILIRMAFLFMLGIAPALSAGEREISIGYFPSITHAHALIAQNMEAEGKGWFEERLPGVKLKWVGFNAGPSAMEALFAKAVDISYVGPGPVLNAFIRSNGGVAVIAGAVRGGSGLVVQADSSLSVPGDFRGKRIATPQLGNTQDIACRHWLTRGGLKVTMAGGDATVVPSSNPDILTLFALGRVDAAWTVEPWLSRLEMEAGGRVAYMEPAESSLTTVLSTGKAFLDSDPELVQAFADAHRELTQRFMRLRMFLFPSIRASIFAFSAGAAAANRLSWESSPDLSSPTPGRYCAPISRSTVPIATVCSCFRTRRCFPGRMCWEICSTA